MVSCRPTARGFTLIELLVVIAIMSILASMIFPSFSRVRESARRSACASNLKQLGQAMELYKQDHDGRFPGAAQYQKWSPGNGHWVAGSGALAALASPYTLTNLKADVEAGALYNYVKNAQVYRCPSNVDGEPKGLTYSMNCALGGALEIVLDTSPLGASGVVLLVDEDKCNDGFLYAADSGTSTDTITQTHNGTGNLLFADGHVKAYPFHRFPLASTVGDPAARLLKLRFDEAPALQLSATSATQNHGFGSCAAP